MESLYTLHKQKNKKPKKLIMISSKENKITEKVEYQILVKEKKQINEKYCIACNFEGHQGKPTHYDIEIHTPKHHQATGLFILLGNSIDGTTKKHINYRFKKLEVEICELHYRKLLRTRSIDKNAKLPHQLTVDFDDFKKMISFTQGKAKKKIA